jgi:hypothetical protein
VSLPESVVERLQDEQCQFALIGASALVFHGISRATQDTDLFTRDRRALDPN